jgi:hypothetical protein
MAELTRRYIVMAMATEGPFDLRDADGAFVLKPWKDPAALQALATYRDHCYPELAEELGVWIKAIASGPVIRGGVGARNEQRMAAMAKPRPKPRAEPQRKPPQRKPRAKVQAKSHPRAKGKMKVAERIPLKSKGKRRR